MDEYARTPQTPVTIHELIELGKHPKLEAELIRNAEFLRRELPVRLALRLKDLEYLPYIVTSNPHILAVYELYVQSFEKLRLFPPVYTPAHEKEFSALLGQLVLEHSVVIPKLARGFLECREYISPVALSAFFDRKISARIGIRMLAEHHLALHESPQPGFVGIICESLRPRSVIANCTRLAQELSLRNYGEYPPIEIEGQTDSSFAYIPVHLEYIVFELLKNAIRATIEHARLVRRPGYQRGAFNSMGLNSSLPPIRVLIARNDCDLTIRIRDEGGGVPPQAMTDIWMYSYTTVKSASATTPPTENETIFSDTLHRDMEMGLGGPMAGLGFGLPMSRVYANYFRGSLDVFSMYGYGFDVFLRLNHLGDQMEMLEI